MAKLVITLLSLFICSSLAVHPVFAGASGLNVDIQAKHLNDNRWGNSITSDYGFQPYNFADFRITVTNVTGSTLHNITVHFDPPPYFVINSSSAINYDNTYNGATTWGIPLLAAGQSQTFRILSQYQTNSAPAGASQVSATAAASSSDGYSGSGTAYLYVQSAGSSTLSPYPTLTPYPTYIYPTVTPNPTLYYHNPNYPQNLPATGPADTLLLGALALVFGLLAFLLRRFGRGF